MNTHPFLLLGALLLSTSIEADCAAQSGFELGLLGEPAASGCEQTDYGAAFSLGRQIGLLRSEQAELSASAGTEGEAAARQAARLRVIERELAQLEGLARIQGLLETGP